MTDPKILNRPVTGVIVQYAYACGHENKESPVNWAAIKCPPCKKKEMEAR